MSKYKVLTDGNGSDLIQVVGLGFYVPLSRLQAAKTELKALAAQVEALRESWEVVKATDWDKPLEEVFAATPQQHLRDVRAEAGRAGFIAGWVSWSAKGDVKVKSDNYAESVRAGEV